MKNAIKSLALSATLVAAFTGTVFAETIKKSDVRAAKIERRIEKQEKRIEEGVKSGKLTPEQGQALSAKETEIKNKEQAEAKNGLSKSEFKQLNQELNGAGKEIRADKHAKNNGGK